MQRLFLVIVIPVIMGSTFVWPASRLAAAAVKTRLGPPEKRSINNDSVPAAAASVNNLFCAQCGECFNAWHQTITGLETQAIRAIERAYALDQSHVHDIGVVTSSGQPELVIGGDGTTMDDLDTTLQHIGERILDNKRQGDLINLLVNEFDSIEHAVNTSKHDLASIPVSTGLLSVRLANLNASISSNGDLLNRVGKRIDEQRQELDSIQEIISPKAAAKSIMAHKNRSHYALLKATRDNCDFSPRFDQFTAGFSTELARIRYLKRQMDLIGAKILNSTIGIYLPEYHARNAKIPSHLVNLPAFQRNASLVQESAKSLAAEARRLFDEHQLQHLQSNESKLGDIEAIKTCIQQAQLTISETRQKLAGFDSSLLKTATALGLTGDISQVLNNDTIQWIRAASHHMKVRWSNARFEMAKLESKSVKAGGGGDVESVRKQLVGLATEVNKAFDEALPQLKELRDSLDKDNLEDVINLKSRTETLLRDVDKLRDKSSNLARIRRETGDLIEQTRRLNTIAKLVADNGVEDPNLDGDGVPTKDVRQLLSSAHGNAAFNRTGLVNLNSEFEEHNRVFSSYQKVFDSLRKDVVQLIASKCT